MSRTNYLTILLAWAGVLAAPAAEAHEPTDSRILSFEQATAPAITDDGAEIALSDAHFKHGSRSLRWTWHSAGSELRFAAPVEYSRETPDPGQISTFVFWVYARQPLGGTLRFEFRKQGRTCCWFDYGTDFAGWRGAWVAFDRDMQGTPEAGMDEVVVRADGMPEGELFFDHVIPASFQDIRHHTADTQAPFINSNTDSHWLKLLDWWNEPLAVDPSRPNAPTLEAQLRTIDRRFGTLVLEGRKARPTEELQRRVDRYGIRRNADSTLCGKSIFFVRYAETYLSLGDPDVKQHYAEDGRLLSDCNDLLLDLAVACVQATDPTEQALLRNLYLELTRHLLDQGFTAGSALGTLHHLGYSMRNFYLAPYVMRDALRDAGLLEPVQQAMEWFSGLGEVKRLPETKGMDIDAFNTSLMGRLAALLLIEDGPRKAEYLRRFAAWVDNGLQLTEGTSPCFKSDGTVYHHRRHYPAYATGGFTGATNAVWILSGTDFAVSPTGAENLKRALLEMRFYCNLRSFPLALSGRHPDGHGALIPRHYARLAQAGTPDGSQSLDAELAAAYLRLTPNPKDAASKRFSKAGIAAETAPEGCRVYPYNGSVSMRRGDWLLTAAGHSRYLWAAEIYEGCNLYGRYLTHGSLQLLGNGSPVSAFGSGFRQEGWDWCHIPGTTAAVIPMKRMEADIRNVDQFSGVEEMLLSDESFCGGASHCGRQGAFAMILHEHDKYNGTLRARKSFFFFDNRVVALGSGIENALEGSATHTTLFQNHLDDTHTTFRAGNETCTGTGHRATFDGNAVLEDNFGTRYIVPRGRVTVESAVQHSLHEERATPTEGPFVKAYIEHGMPVETDTYEYLMLVEPTAADRKINARRLPYTVQQCDRRAHIVTDKPTGVHALSLFEAGAVQDAFVREVSLPSILLYSGSGDRRTLSVADPDLRFYEGPSDDRYDADGHRIERSIYSRDWIDNPSAPSTLVVTVRGHWQPTDDSICRATIEGANTRLEFTCREGATREVVLAKTK